MRNASTAMKQIHSGLTVDKVDEQMCVFDFVRQPSSTDFDTGSVCAGNTISATNREALSHGPSNTGAYDEAELDEALEELQQEELDKKMLKTGAVPVGDQVQRLPTAAGDRKDNSKIKIL